MAFGFILVRGGRAEVSPTQASAVCAGEILPERGLSSDWTSHVFAVVRHGRWGDRLWGTQGQRVTGVGKPVPCVPCVSPSEEKGGWCAFDTQHIFMTVLLIFPLRFLSI